MPRLQLLLLLVFFIVAVDSLVHGLSSIWRQSSKIRGDGFLTDHFAVDGLPLSMKVRQVPGDGNCLFHAISACLHFADNGTQLTLDNEQLMPKSAELRRRAVDFLLEDIERKLYLEDGETVPTIELLKVVAEQYNMTAEHYCSVMRKPKVWGGGPEIVALSNALRRPIHVYELGAANGTFCLKRMACFGSPCYDEHCQPIHILSADSRFPNVKPGKQLPTGNHFLALFPCTQEELAALRERLRADMAEVRGREGGLTVLGGEDGGAGGRRARFTASLVQKKETFKRVLQWLGRLPGDALAWWEGTAPPQSDGGIDVAAAGAASSPSSSSSSSPSSGAAAAAAAAAAGVGGVEVVAGGGGSVSSHLPEGRGLSSSAAAPAAPAA